MAKPKPFQLKHGENHPGAVAIGSMAAAGLGVGALGYGITEAVMHWSGSKHKGACPEKDQFLINQPEAYRAYSTGSRRESSLFSTSCWVAEKKDKQYMQIDLMKVKLISGIVVRGCQTTNTVVSKISVFVSTTGNAPKDFKAIGVYDGPSKPEEESKAIFEVPVQAKFVRLYPHEFDGEFPAMRAAVLGCLTADPVPFSTRLNADVTNADGSVSGTPEMYNGSAWNPICGPFFSNNNNGAKIICKSLGLGPGVVYKITGGVYPQDAVFVQECAVGTAPSLQSCVGGGTAPTGTLGVPACAKGQAVGVQVKCSASGRGGPSPRVAEPDMSARVGGDDGMSPRKGADEGAATGGSSSSESSSSGSSSSGNSSWGGSTLAWILGLLILLCCATSWIPFVFCIPRKSRSLPGMYPDEEFEDMGPMYPPMPPGYPMEQNPLIRPWGATIY